MTKSNSIAQGTRFDILSRMERNIKKNIYIYIIILLYT